MKSDDSRDENYVDESEIKLEKPVKLPKPTPKYKLLLEERKRKAEEFARTGVKPKRPYKQRLKKPQQTFQCDTCDYKCAHECKQSNVNYFFRLLHKTYFLFFKRSSETTQALPYKCEIICVSSLWKGL